MALPAVAEIARPLRLGELLAATIRIFGARPWPFLAIGLVEALALLAANSLPYLGGLLLLSVVFAACFGLVTRLVAGDELGSGLARIGQAMPVLLPLGFVVATPFYLGFVAGLVFLVFSAGWLGLTSFSVPAALVEPAEDPGWLARTAQALRRTLLLARTEYVHAAGVAAALVVIYVVLSILLAGLLRGYAENTRLMAQALAQIPLAPFFFIGLSVLYFEQCARALEPPRRPQRRR